MPLSPTLSSSFELDSAAVVSVAPVGSDPQVLITTFGAALLGGDNNVFAIRDATDLKSLYVEQVESGDLPWPNQADLVSLDRENDNILVSGGFLVPGKSTGTIDFYTADSYERTKISTDKSGFFYHHAELADIDGDGAEDILAARVNMPTFGSSTAELIWLDRNNDWKESVLFSGEGPEVGFIFEELDDEEDGLREVIATQFFTAQQLAVFSCADGAAGSWAQCGDIATTVIDDTAGAMFNLQRVDLDGDGRKEILATSNADDGSGSVFAYVQPEGDWRVGNWTRHTLATGYKPPSSFMPGKGAPGTATAFFPDAKTADVAGARPHIVVSGDDSGLTSLLSPPADGGWEYERVDFNEDSTVGTTVGTIGVGDLDGDGITELVVPRYSEGIVSIYTFEV